MLRFRRVVTRYQCTDASERCPQRGLLDSLSEALVGWSRSGRLDRPRRPATTWRTHAIYRPGTHSMQGKRRVKTSCERVNRKAQRLIDTAPRRVHSKCEHDRKKVRPRPRLSTYCRHLSLARCNYSKSASGECMPVRHRGCERIWRIGTGKDGGRSMCATTMSSTSTRRA
jgi:hypothetical protein